VRWRGLCSDYNELLKAHQNSIVSVNIYDVILPMTNLKVTTEITQERNCTLYNVHTLPVMYTTSLHHILFHLLV
jgi:hypothetical protein